LLVGGPPVPLRGLGDACLSAYIGNMPCSTRPRTRFGGFGPPEVVHQAAAARPLGGALAAPLRRGGRHDPALRHALGVRLQDVLGDGALLVVGVIACDVNDGVVEQQRRVGLLALPSECRCAALTTSRWGFGLAGLLGDLLAARAAGPGEALLV